MKKQLLCMALVIVILVSGVPNLNIFASENVISYLEEDFNAESISGSLTGNFDFCDGIYKADGKVLFAQDTVYTLPYNPIAGNFEFSFDLFIPKLDNTSSIKLFDDESQIYLIFENKSDSEIDLYLKNGSEQSFFVSLLKGKWYNLKFKTDAGNSSFEMSVNNESIEGEYSLNALFSKLSFSSADGFYIDNFKILYPLIAAYQKPVIYKAGNYVVAESKLEENFEDVNLVLASYTENDVLYEISFVNTAYKNIARAYLKYNENVSKYKAFILSKQIMPKAKSDKHEKSDVFYSEISVDGTFDLNIENKSLSVLLNEDLPLEVTDLRLLIYNDENLVYTADKKVNEEILVDTSSFNQGGYCAYLYALYNGIYAMPLGKKDFFVKGELPNDDTYIFYMNSSYYYHNGEKVYFDLEDKEYFPIFSQGELYLPKNIIMNNFGIEPEGDNETFALGELLKNEGYHTFFADSGIYVMSRDKFWMEDTLSVITETVFKEGFENSNTDMSVQYWGDSSEELSYEKASEESYNGSFSYRLGAVNSSFLGLKHVFRDYDEDAVLYRVKFMAKASSDYSGNYIRGIDLFYKGSELTSDFRNLSPAISNNWQEYSFEIKPSVFCDKDTMTLGVVTSYDSNCESASGSIYIDDFSVEKVYNGDGILTNKAKEYVDLFNEPILLEDFDGEDKNWQNLPVNWRFFNWATQDTTGTFGTDSITTEKGVSGYLGAVSSSFSGFQSGSIDISKISGGCSVSVDIYADENYKNNAPAISLMMSGENGFLKMVNGTEISNYIVNGEWVRVTSEFPKDVITDDKYTTFGVLLRTSCTDETTTSGGNIYFDNIVVSAQNYLTESIVADITCKNYASWHTLGETVTYTANQNDLEGIDKVEGVVYNSNGEEVFRKTVSAYTIANYGWTYIPSEVGYYEIKFYAMRKDGNVSPIISHYSKAYNNIIGDFELEKHQFAVAKSDAKAFDERNQSLLISTHALQSDDGKLGALLGYYGARIHWIRWGDSVTVSGAHTAPGEYNWDNVDMQFENVESSGLKVTAANIYGTPKWAVKEEYQNLNSNTIAGNRYYNNYAPENISDLTDFVGEFVGRYGDRIEILEFWNEPTKTPTAFWSDSVSNYANMVKAAYSAAKSVKNDITVSFAGVGKNANYTQFYDELLSDDDIYNYYDMIAFHGTYDVSRQLNEKVTSAHGLEPKRWWNSEGYFANYYEKGLPSDAKYQAKAFVVSLLENFKAGAEYITTFQMMDNVSDEYRVFINKNGGAKSTYGLFRNLPEIEPKLSAVVAFNLFNIMNKDFEYIGENEFGDVRAASFKNGSDTLTVLWSKSSTDFEIPQDILASIGNEYKLNDMEGKEYNNTVLKGDCIYYITNVSKENISQVLGNDNNNVLNPSMQAPYFNSQVVEEMSENDILEADISTVPLFDNSTFEVNKDIQFISEGFKWSGVDSFEKPADFNAKFSVYAYEQGIQLIADVTDILHYNQSDGVEDISEFDSVMFSIDCENSGLAKDRSEFIMGLTDSGAVLYKGFAADIGNSALINYTQAYSPLSDNYVNIYREGNHTYYKLFIPVSELYPYVYPGNSDGIRVTLTVNNNDQNGKNGILCWGGGYEDSIVIPSKFGKLNYGVTLKSEFDEDGYLKISGNTFSGSDNVTIRVMNDENIYYLAQISSDSEGRYEDIFPASLSSSYDIYVCGTGHYENYCFTGISS